MVRRKMIFTGNFSNARLTAERTDAIVKAKGLRNPHDSGRCLRHGGKLRNNHKHTCIVFAGLREPVRVIVRGASIVVFLTPYQARSFYAPKKGTKGGNNNDRNDRRSYYARHASTAIAPNSFPYGMIRSNDPLCILIRNFKEVLE